MPLHFSDSSFQHLASYGVILFLLVVSVYWINLRKSKKVEISSIGNGKKALIFEGLLLQVFHPNKGYSGQ